MSWLHKSLSESIPKGEKWVLYVGNSSLDFGEELPNVVIVRTLEGLKRLTGEEVKQVVSYVSPEPSVMEEVRRIRAEGMRSRYANPRFLVPKNPKLNFKLLREFEEFQEAARPVNIGYHDDVVGKMVENVLRKRRNNLKLNQECDSTNQKKD